LGDVIRQPQTVTLLSRARIRANKLKKSGNLVTESEPVFEKNGYHAVYHVTTALVTSSKEDTTSYHKLPPMVTKNNNILDNLENPISYQVTIKNNFAREKNPINCLIGGPHEAP